MKNTAASSKRSRTGNAPTDVRKTSPGIGEVHRMIADAAYFRAINRGFGAGQELEDWLMAEQEISRMLASKLTSDRGSPETGRSS